MNHSRADASKRALRASFPSVDSLSDRWEGDEVGNPTPEPALFRPVILPRTRREHSQHLAVWDGDGIGRIFDNRLVFLELAFLIPDTLFDLDTARDVLLDANNECSRAQPSRSIPSEPIRH